LRPSDFIHWVVLRAEKVAEMNNRITVLSIDGGGIRGIIPAVVLDEIERRTGKRIYQLFDLIAGTSTGGILALLLTKPAAKGGAEYTATDVINSYAIWGPQIFRRSVLHRVLALGNLAKEKYPAEGIEGVLTEYFGDTELRDALTEILIPTFDIEKGMPIYFKRRSAREKEGARSCPMRVVARATCSAPTYFSPSKIARGRADYFALVDGGVFANNPAVCAYAEAKRMARPSTNSGDIDVVVVSLGTGQRRKPISFNSATGWGLIGWSNKLLDVVLDSVSEGAHGQMTFLLPTIIYRRDSELVHRKRYYRFQVPLEESDRKLDNASEQNMRRLQLRAQQYIEERGTEIEELCSTLLER
jgi:patatin-like phospholipase/acyl hydrolase